MNEDEVEEIQLIPQERTTECTVEQIVDGAVPQLDEGLVEATGAVRVLQEEMCELTGILVERTERERQSNLGKILDEVAEMHITQRAAQERARRRLGTGPLFEAAQMRDNASSEYHVVSQVGSAADVEHGFFWCQGSARYVVNRPSSASRDCCVQCHDSRYRF